MRVLGCAGAQSDDVEQFRGLCPGGFDWFAAQVVSDDELFCGCQGRQQVWLLKDYADFLPPQRGEFLVAESRGVSAIDEYEPMGGADEGRGGGQKTGFTRPGRPDEGSHLTGLYVEVH